MLTLVSLIAALAAPAPQAIPCEYVRPAEAAKLLGATPGVPQTTGPEKDDETGAMRSTCVYVAGTRLLMILEDVFKDANTARTVMTREALRARLEDDEDIVITEETGLGDKAYWVTLKGGAQYVVVKGATVLTIALGGLPVSAAELKPRLKAAISGK